MALFAIADLHLSRARNKKMDIFGENWKDHDLKIEQNWRHNIGDDDIVILGGDISWAMRTDEAAVDLEFIDRLPGKKILHSGNHDYWWDSTSKLNNMFESIYFLKNNFFPYKDYAVCGSRGWLCPNDSHFSRHDEKIYKREVLRCTLSFDKAVESGYNKFIFTLHYPPTNDKKERSAFLDIAEKHRPHTVLYGHLHGENSFYASIMGEVDGINYKLVSADYLDFMPLKILD